jgi:hypothetical protein
MVFPDTGLPDVETTSTISSRAVSGSMTIVNTSLAATDTPPRRDAADTTVIDAPLDVTALDSVVCCERDEYLLTVGIDVPYRRE